MPQPRPADLRELDLRRSDGMDIRLLWSRSEDRLLVTVDDSRTGAWLEIDVREPGRALDVFHHPFAYALQARAELDAATTPRAA